MFDINGWTLDNPVGKIDADMAGHSLYASLTVILACVIPMHLDLAWAPSFEYAGSKIRGFLSWVKWLFIAVYSYSFSVFSALCYISIVSYIHPPKKYREKGIYFCITVYKRKYLFGICLSFVFPLFHLVSRSFHSWKFLSVCVCAISS